MLCECAGNQPLGAYIRQPTLVEDYVSKRRVQRKPKIIDKKPLYDHRGPIGLFAHGVGIGSFVYLRRVFEILVEQVHQIAKEADGWDEKSYSSKRMKEKIEMFQDHLPSRFARPIGLYGILSKGIYQLIEEECNEKFPFLRQTIQSLLKEKQYDSVINPFKMSM